MTAQWGRVARVIVGKKGSGLEIVDLRIGFEVEKTAESKPNKAIIKIYNLSPKHEGRVKNEFEDVFLSAGYQGAERQLFAGNITNVYRYREGNNFVTEIEAGDGDADYITGSINKSFAAGVSKSEIVSAIADEFVGGTSLGYNKLPTGGSLRGVVVSGASRDVLDNISRETGVTWSIQDGKLIMVPVDELLPGQAVLLTSQTGLKAPPEISDKGVEVVSLLNPLLRVHGAIKLDNNTIKVKRQKPEFDGQSNRKVKNTEPVRRSQDGIYKILSLKHVGDTHAPQWDTRSICIGLGEPLPQVGGDDNAE